MVMSEADMKGECTIRIFVTGASGHIGAALVPELLGAGHQVLGLARSDASADKLTVAGAEVVRGSLDDLDVLAKAGRESGGVIHLAFRHDLVYAGDIEGAAVGDSKAIKAMGTALDGSSKPFVGIGGTLMVAMMGINDRPGTETDFVPEGVPVASRENDVIAFADNGVRASVVRFAPVVHSELDREGFVPALIGFAKQKGSAAYVGDGSNRRSAVSTHDGATLLRLAVESAPAARRREERHRVQGDRRNHWQEPRAARHERHAGGGAGVPQLPGHVRCRRQPRAEQPDARAIRLAAEGRRPDRGPQ
jgi:nucleoside-diphosphate-sugar epimerase